MSSMPYVFSESGLEQQEALRRVSVPPRPACLLQVALQRTRDLGVHDHAYVRLVDSHAKRIGHHHHVDAPRVEAPLDFAFPFGREAEVEMLRRHSALGERLGRLLGTSLGRVVDDGATRTL